MLCALPEMRMNGSPRRRARRSFWQSHQLRCPGSSPWAASLTWIFPLEWRDGLCKLKDDEGREIPLELRNRCPRISRLEGEKILQWLDEAMVYKGCLDLEVAMTLKMKEIFPNLPDEVMMGLIPRLEQVRAADFGSKVPWNRHKRRRIQKAKNLIVHIVSGPTSAFGSNSALQLPLRFCAWTRTARCQLVCLTRTSSPTCSHCVPQAASKP